MNEDEAAKRSRLWEYRRVLEEILVARINYALVAQSMLLVAFATVFAGAQHVRSTIVEHILAAAGVILAIAQGFLALSVTRKADRLDKAHLQPLDADYKQIMALWPQG